MMKFSELYSQNIIMNQQNSIRHQLLQLANKCNEESHNLNAFKRRKSLTNSSAHKFMNHTLSTQVDQSKQKHHSADKNISTILGERNITKRSAGQNNNKAKKKPHITDYSNNGFTQNIIKNRNTTHFTLLINKEKANSSALINHLKVNSRAKFSNSQRDNNFPEQEKNIFKKKSLSDNHLQEWINHILIERCPQQKFDKGLTNAALKRFQIDKNSLISYGISQANVSRILKSLFVYSIGFNNLLAEIGNNKIQVKKNLWKVFCVLVQYCSEGSVQTILSTIQKENDAQLQFVSSELQKHKQIIENNQTITIEKNEKISSQNKDLKYKAELLQMDRNILKQSLQQSERAFQEQVSLRLRFQQKISDLHNLHRELQIKHYKLFSDFQLKNNQLVYFKDKSTFYYNEHLRIKKELAAFEDVLTEKERDCKLAVELAAKLKKQLYEKGTYDAQRRIQKKISENIIRQKQIIQTQLNSKLKNIQTAMQCNQKSYKQLNHVYYQSLDQNKRLVNKLNNEVLQITHRLMEQKNINYSNAHYLSEIELLNAKIQRKMQIVVEMQANLQENLEKMAELEVELQTRASTNQVFQQTTRQANLTIAKLKQINQDLSAANQQIQQINQTLSTKLKEAEEQLNTFKESSKMWRAKYDQSIVERQKYKTKSEILSQQIPKLQSSLRNNLDSVQNTKKAQQQKLRRVQAQLVQKTVELDKVKSYYSNIEDQFKNEQFQRKNILIQYKHLLNAYQQSSDVIKEHAKKVSENQRNFQNAALQLRIAKIQSEQMDKKYKVQLQEKAEQIKYYRQNPPINFNQIHPMQLEDALSHLLRQALKNQTLQQQMLSVDDEKQQLMIKMQQKYIKYSQQQKNRQIQLKQLIARKQLQLQYELKKSKAYVDKIEYLQLTIIAKDIKQEERNAQSYRQRQKRYLQVITDNNFKVNTLMTHLQSIQNYNEQLSQTVQNNQQQIANLSEEITQLTRENQQLTIANHQLSEQTQLLEQFRQNLLRQLAEKEQFITKHLPQYNKLKQSSSSKKMKRSRQSSPSAKNKKKSKDSIIKPMFVQRQQKQQQVQLKVRQEQKKMFKTDGWREDFSQKLKSTFGYYA